ncbi:MAG TPA: hypothetical protein DIW77_06265 [Chromatiaceae bacterium]|jgi:hypothetical protein|nr:MAG: hypothetical protein N838_08180 [Thiohalocapsa sp. PB-PSB1]HCS89665.1 hypothetical protein [Chromatiaceae bacterium]
MTTKMTTTTTTANSIATSAAEHSDAKISTTRGWTGISGQAGVQAIFVEKYSTWLVFLSGLDVAATRP